MTGFFFFCGKHEVSTNVNQDLVTFQDQLWCWHDFMTFGTARKWPRKALYSAPLDPCCFKA